MRDIVNSNGFSASNLQTKSKVAKMPSNSSGTLTRGDYRSYRDFVESYGDNKNCKDDQESVSSTESGISSYNLSESKSNNTSTSSLNSEINGTSSKNVSKTEGVAIRTGSFRNYLESYNHKKFSPVRPVPPKQNTVKSEIVIQVNDPLEQQKSSGSKHEPVFVTTINGDAEGEDSTDSLPPPPNSLPPFPPNKIINGHQGYCYLLPPPPPPPFEEPKSDHRVEGVFIPPIAPPQIFGNSNQGNGGCAPPPPPPPPLSDFNQPPTGGKKWDMVQVDGHCSKPKTNQQEKLPPNHAAATNLAKILTQHLLPRRKELESRLNAAEQEVSHKSAPNSPPTMVKNKQTWRAPPPPPKVTQNGQNNGGSSENYTCFIALQPPLPRKYQLLPPTPSTPPPPPPPMSNYCTLPRPHAKSAAPSLPRSPPPKFEFNSSQKQFQKMVTVEMVAPKLPGTSPPKFETNNDVRQPMVTQSSPHLPRSLPPSNVPKQPQKMATVEMSAPKLPQTSAPKLVNGQNSSNGTVEFSTTTVVPVNDASTKVSKNDPNVRKLVYNTYRGLLGAYNNKANDMIATLPRSRVREDQGVSKQLESIALQGGLEKLNGRTNPNVEQDERNQ